MQTGLRTFWRVLRGAAAEWSEDKVSRMAAALAFYTVFSLTPLALIAVAVAGLFFTREAAIDELLDQMKFLVGPSGADALRLLIDNAPERGESRVASVLGIGMVIFLATSVFAELKESLNTIWEVQTKRGLSIISTLRTQLLSFAMVLVVGFLLLVSLVASAVLSAAGRYVSGLLPVGWIGAAHFAVSLVAVTVLFALIYKVLPDVYVHWRDVWMGAVFTAVLFVVGKSLFGIYLGHSTVGSSFGAAGSLVIVVLWTYYSAQILLFGAEMTQVHARIRGEAVVPTERAAEMTEHQRVQQGMPRTESVPTAEDEPQASGAGVCR